MSETIRVRVAIAINENGDWMAQGWRAKGKTAPDKAIEFLEYDSKAGAYETVYFIECDVPVPVQKVVTLKAELATEDI